MTSLWHLQSWSDAGAKRIQKRAILKTKAS